MTVSLIMGRLPPIVAADRNDYLVSLLDENGIEHMIDVFPDTPVEGTFGQVTWGDGYEDITVPEPEQITGVRISNENKLLSIDTIHHVSLVWRIAA